jgi:hypothetical protein
MSETVEPASPEPAAAEPPKDKNRRLLMIAAVASAATVAFILGAVLYYMRTFTVTGTATTTSHTWARGTCTTYGQFHPRAAVIVYDAAGAVVGTGQLDGGTPIGNYRCEYKFIVSGVRDGGAAVAENTIRAAHAACWYSWRVPPRRSCRRMSRRAMRTGSTIEEGTG